MNLQFFLISNDVNMAFVIKTGLDMVVRDENGDILDTNQSSTTQLYQHHMYAIERIRKATVSVFI